MNGLCKYLWTFLQKLEPENNSLKTGQRRASLWSAPKDYWALETGKPGESTSPVSSGHSASPQSHQHMLASPVVCVPESAGGWKVLFVDITHSIYTAEEKGSLRGSTKGSPEAGSASQWLSAPEDTAGLASQLHLPALPRRMCTCWVEAISS